MRVPDPVDPAQAKADWEKRTLAEALSVSAVCRDRVKAALLRRHRL